MPEKITLHATSDWITCVLHDHEFDVEVGEALSLLVDIEHAHANDPHHCQGCHQPTKTYERCEHCGCVDVYASQLFLDDVARMLVDRYHAPKCSRSEALHFHTVVVDRVNQEKKTSQTTRQ